MKLVSGKGFDLNMPAQKKRSFLIQKEKCKLPRRAYKMLKSNAG